MKLNNKGFTLIEMLMVVAIIAILASVFLVGLRGFRGSAYDARRLSDLQKVQGYLEIYYNRNREYPNAASWVELSTALTGDSGAGISSIPNDPLSSQSYEYGVSADLQNYVLKTTLSDPNAKSLDDALPSGTYNGVSCDKSAGDYCVSP